MVNGVDMCFALVHSNLPQQGTRGGALPTPGSQLNAPFGRSRIIVPRGAVEALPLIPSVGGTT